MQRGKTTTKSGKKGHKKNQKRPQEGSENATKGDYKNKLSDKKGP